MNSQSTRSLTVGAGAGLTARLRILISGLSRFGLFNRLLRRLGRREFGVDRPLPFLIEHYSRKWLG